MHRFEPETDPTDDFSCNETLTSQPLRGCDISVNLRGLAIGGLACVLPHDFGGKAYRKHGQSNPKEGAEVSR